jgi:hypothetical protein
MIAQLAARCAAVCAAAGADAAAAEMTVVSGGVLAMRGPV